MTEIGLGADIRITTLCSLVASKSERRISRKEVPEKEKRRLGPQHSTAVHFRRMKTSEVSWTRGRRKLAATEAYEIIVVQLVCFAREV